MFRPAVFYTLGMTAWMVLCLELSSMPAFAMKLEVLKQKLDESGGYGYDAAGRRTALTVAGQPAVAYAWDDADRLTAIDQEANTVNLAYDAASRRTTLTLPNGIALEYGYDNANQLTSLTYKQGATVLGDLSNAYDAGGRRTAKGGSLADTGLPAELGSASFDAADKLVTRNGQALRYDANGSLLADGTRSFTWDARNRLASLSGPASANFQYDAFGRRIAKTVNGVTTRFLHGEVARSGTTQPRTRGTSTCRRRTQTGCLIRAETTCSPSPRRRRATCRACRSS